MEKVEKFALNEDHFLFMEQKLLGMGFSETTGVESGRLFARLDLIPPRKIIGREASFIYKSTEQGNNYTVKVHTTYLKASRKWRDKSTDLGWCLIVDGDKAKYFAKPFLRTKGYILKILRYAWVTKWKVDHRPLCRECHGLMEVNGNFETGQYYWVCWKKGKHQENKPIFERWDTKLPPKATEYIKIRRAYTARYRRKLKKEGKIVRPARKIRRPWIVKNRENLV